MQIGRYQTMDEAMQAMSRIRALLSLVASLALAGKTVIEADLTDLNAYLV
jgi:hypothetical protein